MDQLADHAGIYAGNDQSYTYLGLSTIVQELDGNGIELSYIKQSGESNGPSQDPYIGLDQFGRVVDQRWMPASNPSSPVDRFQYGYDQSGNVLYKNNLVNSSFSELYHANSTTSGDNRRREISSRRYSSMCSRMQHATPRRIPRFSVDPHFATSGHNAPRCDAA